MKSSQTHRSLSNKRNISQNHSSENLEIPWDNIGLINHRLTPLQQLKVPVFKKYQGDKILEHKRKATYDDTILLPSIDYSSKMNNTINQSAAFAKKHPLVLFPSSIKKEIKSDKIKLLVMLSQLKKEYLKDKKPTITVCLLLQEVLDILQKQDNIYGEDMKTLFTIIYDMIFCVQQDIIECVQKIQVSIDKKSNDSIAIKPYFEYITVMKDEIDRHQTNALSFHKKLEDEIRSYQNLLKQAELKFYATGESQRKEIESINKNHQGEIILMQQNTDNINEELQRAIKENTIIRESAEKWKNKFEDQEKRFIDQIQQTQEFNLKYEQYKNLFEQSQQELENIDFQYNQILREKQYIEEHLQSLTPRPKMFSHNFYEMMGINGYDFENVSTNEKFEFFKDKLEEKISEVNNLQNQQKSKQIKKKGSRVLGVFVQTKRQGSVLDEKQGQVNGGSLKNLDKSPTRKKPSDQKARLESIQISPSSPSKAQSKEAPSSFSGNFGSAVRRSLKKSSTLVQFNKNTASEEPQNSSFSELQENIPQLKSQPKSQEFISQQQSDQISNVSSKTRQSEERRVQFKQNISGSEQGSPKTKFNNARHSNFN